MEGGFLYIGSEVGQCCGTGPGASQNHLLPSFFPVEANGGGGFSVLSLFDFVSHLQVGPFTLPQDIDACF